MQLVEKVLPVVPVANAGVVGSTPSFADVLVAPLGVLKPSLMEAQAPVVICSDLGSRLPLGGSAYSLEALRNLAMDFLAKVRQRWTGLFFLGWA
jgi:hypothetical protein